MPTVLVTAADSDVLRTFQVAFADAETTVLSASSARDALVLCAEHGPDVVVLDVDVPDLGGLETLRRIRAIDAKLPVVFVTGGGSADTAIEAMKCGVYEYLTKPLDVDELRDTLERAILVSVLMHRPVVLGEVEEIPPKADLLVGRSGAMQEVYKKIGRVAPHDMTVLLLGESGTGKELVARAIYQHSLRAAAPFLPINCAAIPETLLESELFGHERGAFTGADRKRIGKFEQCAGGTLFLDEIGDMPHGMQAKLLRVLQERRFERVGGNETIIADVRVIAATNCDLEKKAAAGQFRADLYYRLNTYTIRLPALREKLDDLPALTDYCLRRFSRTLGKDVTTVSPAAMQVLRSYSWPGNVRQLEGVLKESLLRATGPTLTPDFLSMPGSDSSDSGSAVADPDVVNVKSFVDARIRAGSTSLYSDLQDVVDRRLCLHVLQRTGGNLTQAAKLLGINRSTLRLRLDAIGIAVEKRLDL